MKRFLKAISMLSITLMLVVLTGCNQDKFYKEWSNAGAEIEEENIFEYIELDEVATKISNGDTFVVVCASSKNSQSITVINTLQSQHDYLCPEKDVTIYVVDSTDFDKSSRKTAKEKLGLSKAVTSDGSPIIMTYEKGIIGVETNWLDKIQTQEFVVNGTFQSSALASYIFKDLLA